MIRIAIVGEIGSGKSYISNLFGFPVFNADEEVSIIYKKNKKFYLKLKKKLPNFIKTFPINKVELFNSILKDKENLNKISMLIHPIVRNKMKKFIRKNRKKKAVILDIPLYLENNIYKKNDIIIYVSAKKSEIMKRVRLRKGFSLKVYKQLKNIQFSNEKKKNKAGFFIKNNFNKKSLKKKINVLKSNIFSK